MRETPWDLPLGGRDSTPGPVTDTAGFLLGRWSVVRQITDHRNGVNGSFTGEAVFSEPSQSDDGLLFTESGRIDFGAHAGPASRTLRYIPQDDGTAQVLFADGHFYIDLDLRSGSCDRVHDCVADRYEIDVRVISAGVVEERWRVRGPEKDYTALTIFTRLVADSASAETIRRVVG